jgi:predicted kinase
LSAPTLAGQLLADLPTHADRWRRPVIVALWGLPGTGKSALAAALAERLPLTLLSTDALRLRHGLASGPATHELIYDLAGPLLRRGGGVLWDGIHATRAHRAAVRAFAEHHGAHLELVRTTAADATIRERLARRAAAPERTTAEGKFVVTPEKLAQFVAWLEPPGPDEPAGLTVDTTEGAPADVLAPLVARLEPLLASGSRRP